MMTVFTIFTDTRTIIFNLFEVIYAQLICCRHDHCFVTINFDFMLQSFKFARISFDLIWILMSQSTANVMLIW